MIKPFTCLCLLAAASAGAYLYTEKHRTALLDREIGRVMHQTEAAHARTGLLRAEWALLNEPGRLSDMAGRYLSLHPMAPTQFVQISDLSGHLPAAAALVADAAEEEDAPVAPPAGPAEPAMADAGLPAHHPMQPAAKADAPRPDVHAAQKLLARAEPHRPPHHVALADREDPAGHDGMLAHSTPLPLAAPRPLGASVYNAMARPLRAQPPRIVAAVPSYAPALGSSLGGGGSTLPPPVPYGR